MNTPPGEYSGCTASPIEVPKSSVAPTSTEASVSVSGGIILVATRIAATSR